MKRKVMTVLVSVSALLMIAVIAGVAQSDTTPIYRSGSRALEGPWMVTVTPRNCQTGVAGTSFPRTILFAQGGTLSEFAAAVSPNLRGPGQGWWAFGSSGSFSYALHFLRFNPDGTYAGRVVERRELRLNEVEQSFSATGSGTVYNATGDVIFQSCATEEGVRFE